MSFNIQHFWDAPLAVQLHVIAALTALGVGIYIFSRRKGTPAHRNLGKFWVVAMVGVAGSSFFIHQIKTWGLFSPIHLLSVFTLASLVWAIYAIRNGNVTAHEYAMKGLFVGGLLVAGALTFSRDLLMHRIFFGSNGTSFIPAPAQWPGGMFTFVFATFALVFGAMFVVSWISRTPAKSKEL